jgi:hypothetical protein
MNTEILSGKIEFAIACYPDDAFFYQNKSWSDNHARPLISFASSLLKS